MCLTHTVQCYVFYSAYSYRTICWEGYRHEAKLVSGLVRYLLKQGYTSPGDITVLTPYLGQLFLLRDVVGRANVLRVEVSYV